MLFSCIITKIAVKRTKTHQLKIYFNFFLFRFHYLVYVRAVEFFPLSLLWFVVVVVVLLLSGFIYYHYAVFPPVFIAFSIIIFHFSFSNLSFFTVFNSIKLIRWTRENKYSVWRTIEWRTFIWSFNQFGKLEHIGNKLKTLMCDIKLRLLSFKTIFDWNFFEPDRKRAKKLLWILIFFPNAG